MGEPVFSGYDELQNAYGDPENLMYRKMRMVVDAITGGRALLDFGCGEGELLARVKDRFKVLVGMDATEEALSITSKRLAGAARLYRYEGRMPETGETFDWVTCLDVLEHLPDPASVLKEINANTAPGGRLIVTVPNWYDIIYSKLLKLNRYHIHAHTPWGWAAIIRRGGFRVTGIRAVGFPLIKSGFLAKNLYHFGMCIFITAVKE